MVRALLFIGALCLRDALFFMPSGLLESSDSRLDATLCFVSDGKSKGNRKQSAWDSGDVGGFECYIKADQESALTAAEVYGVEDEAGEVIV